MENEPKSYRPKPDIIAIFYDTLTHTYLCSPQPFDTVDEAVADMDPTGDRYTLENSVIVH